MPSIRGTRRHRSTAGGEVVRRGRLRRGKPLPRTRSGPRRQALRPERRKRRRRVQLGPRTLVLGEVHVSPGGGGGRGWTERIFNQRKLWDRRGGRDGRELVESVRKTSP
jgi:hypothetical protein